MHLNSKNANSPYLKKYEFQKYENKSPIHENIDANITCDFGDDRCRIAAAWLEKDIFVRTDFRVQPSYIK